MCKIYPTMPVLPFRQLTDDESIEYLMELENSHQRQQELFASRQYLELLDEQADIACFVRDFKESHNPIGFE